MRVSVRLFAVCRERVKADAVEIGIAGNSATLKELREELARAAPSLAPLLPWVRIAVNEEFASDDDPVLEGDDVALIPPVSGGAGAGPFAVGPEPIRADDLIAAVRVASAGAVVTFAGTVRDSTGGLAVTALEYEAYEPMAVRCLRRIADEVRARWPEASIAIRHRTGRLEIGEISVVIAVSSPHRRDAFDACRYAIERLKEDVPIWKKEIRRDGSVWVGIGS